MAKKKKETSQKKNHKRKIDIDEDENTMKENSLKT